MGGDKQIQKAGDNSQQVQANNINIIMGIDEKRAREIFNEMYTVARRDFTQDAYECANERVAKFEESLMPKIMKIDGALKFFADPSFQFLLTRAHKTAASTEREKDYDLLSELLIYRVQTGGERKKRIGITRAVEIIDEIDDDALCGITVAYAVTGIQPKAGSVLEGLDTLNSLFEKLIYMGLPTGREWLEHLDILDTVRISRFGNLKKIEQYYPDAMPGYVCSGIDIESSNYKAALTMLREVGLSERFLVPNELKDGFVRLPVINKSQIRKLKPIEQMNMDGKNTQVLTELSERQKNVLENIFTLYNHEEKLKKEVISRFIDEWDKRSALRMLHTWWDSIPVAFDISIVGRVLAHANAQRCYKTFPPLEE